MKWLILGLAALLLAGAAPWHPMPPPLMATVAPFPAGRIVAEPYCTYETAPMRLRAVVHDRRGYPYGEVRAWSCGRMQQALDEFVRRWSDLQVAALR